MSHWKYLHSKHIFSNFMFMNVRVRYVFSFLLLKNKSEKLFIDWIFRRPAQPGHKNVDVNKVLIENVNTTKSHKFWCNFFFFFWDLFFFYWWDARLLSKYFHNSIRFRLQVFFSCSFSVRWSNNQLDISPFNVCCLHIYLNKLGICEFTCGEKSLNISTFCRKLRQQRENMNNNKREH